MYVISSAHRSIPFADVSLVYHWVLARYSVDSTRNISPPVRNVHDEVMAFDGGKTSAERRLKLALIDQLELGIDLIEHLDDQTFSGSDNGRGSVGAHIRHNINFVDAVIDGAISGSIDNTDRSRDRRIETDRSAASTKLRSLIEALVKVPMNIAELVSVASELDPMLQHPSTLGRELEFAISHTIHHYALIRERLESSGVQFDPRFGIAPSTLEYWRTAKR